MITNKVKKLDHYPFDGWDFMELADAWNIHVPDDCWIPGYEGWHPEISDSGVISIYLEGVMKKYGGGEPTRVMKKCAKDIRIYCELLSKGISCDAPLWGGMAQIECDWTIIRYTIDLVGSMWD